LAICTRPVDFIPESRDSSAKLRGEPAFHRIRIHQACLLKLELSIGEDGEVGNALDFEARGEIRELFGIDLEHNRATSEVARHLRNVGRRHSAGAAPLGPEIH